MGFVLQMPDLITLASIPDRNNVHVSMEASMHTSSGQRPTLRFLRRPLKASRPITALPFGPSARTHITWPYSMEPRYSERQSNWIPSGQLLDSTDYEDEKALPNNQDASIIWPDQQHDSDAWKSNNLLDAEVFDFGTGHFHSDLGSSFHAPQRHQRLPSPTDSPYYDAQHRALACNFPDRDLFTNSPSKLVAGNVYQPNRELYRFKSTLSDVQPLAASASASDDMTADEPYNKLLHRCLMQAPNHELQLKQIYDWFRENTNKKYMPHAKGWQNSIRHNLSMNDASSSGP
jgi:hypothetical protein